MESIASSPLSLFSSKRSFSRRPRSLLSIASSPASSASPRAPSARPARSPRSATSGWGDRGASTRNRVRRFGWACRRRSLAFSSPPSPSPPHSPPPEEETTPRRATLDFPIFYRGYGGFGALGHSVYHRELLPRLVNGPWSGTISHLATSGAHTAAITDSGDNAEAVEADLKY